MKYLAQNVTPALVKNADSMDIKDIAKNLDQF